MNLNFFKYIAIYYRDQFVTQYITYLNVWGVLSKIIVFIATRLWVDNEDDDL